MIIEGRPCRLLRRVPTVPSISTASILRGVLLKYFGGYRVLVL